VVIACPDPDPRVAGRGAAILKEAGIAVAEDVLRPEAERQNRGFLHRIADRRPMVTVKVAASLDGRVATSTGDSKWITGKRARRLGHLLRASHDGIAVGSGTVAADNPALTCRLPGMANWSPVRIVFSGSGGVAATSRLVRSARETPTWIVTAKARDNVPRDEMEAAGVHVIEVGDGSTPGLNIKAALTDLAELGLTRLLVEGGPRLATAFLRAGAVDRLAWFAAPRLLGGDALAAVAELGVDQVAGSFDLEPVDTILAGADMLRMFDVVGRSAGEV
jgi:diaminohydroxyphosphoribosylaminopyrimidine deaminase/5-amino-6-(5-phosphoribosylamino)uracil reductase